MKNTSFVKNIQIIKKYKDNFEYNIQKNNINKSLIIILSK